MSLPTVWLSGPPGSGKTTAGRRAAEELGRGFASAGEYFRALARERGRTLVQFSADAERDREIDATVDRRLADAARARPGTVLDGRVVGALMRREHEPVLALRVTASEPVRARRVAERDGVPVEAALAEIRARSESEHARYLRWYGLDPEREPFDAVVDATDLDRETVVERVVATVRARGGG